MTQFLYRKDFIPKFYEDRHKELNSDIKTACFENRELVEKYKDYLTKLIENINSQIEIQKKQYLLTQFNDFCNNNQDKISVYYQGEKLERIIKDWDLPSHDTMAIKNDHSLAYIESMQKELDKYNILLNMIHWSELLIINQIP